MKENWRKKILFDLQFTIITIKILILPQELEKKRNEERVRQKAWEQRHRLGSFRRRAKLPVPADEEAEPSVPTTQSEEQTTTTGPAPTPSPAQQPPSSIPPGQYLRPVYPTTGQLSGRATPGRRLSDVGLATSMLGRYRFMHELKLISMYMYVKMKKNMIKNDYILLYFALLINVWFGFL